MLTKDDLLIQDTLPNIRDISLKLYKEFATDILLNRQFIYYFNDNSKITVEFREWGIYHMLSMQHINGRIGKNKFFEKIDNGLELSYFESNRSLSSRYKREKSRITMFSCIYNSLRNGMAFYIPSGKVKNTKDVELDYIIFNVVDNKGMNIGIRNVGNVHVPITILISKQIDQKKYLDDSEFKLVRKLEIVDEHGNILEEKCYTPNVMSRKSFNVPDCEKI